MSQQFWQWWNWFWSDAGGAWAGVFVAIVGFWFALRSLRGMTTQNSLSADALKESKNAFLLTNRPRVRVRRVILVDAPHTGTVFVRARVDFANVGNTDARIHDLRGGILFSKERAIAGDAQFSAAGQGPAMVLKPGETQTFEFETGELGFEDFAGYQDGKRHCFAVGRLRYLDDLNIQRETAFCRRLNVQTSRFEAVDDPDFEYED